MSNLVVLRTFLYRHEAEFAKITLETNDIFSIIAANDLGGMRPYMSFGSSIKLYVFDFDRDRAEEILEHLG